MGKKGKGRQSGGFTHKSLRAQQQYELQQSISSITNNGSRKSKTHSSSSSSLVRPRLATGLSQLRGLLRERQFQEDVQLMERRRRNGFLPQPQDQQENHHHQQQNHRVCLVGGSSTNTNDFSNDPSSILVHPAGWILKHSSPIFDSVVRDDRPHNYNNNENGDDGDDENEEDGTVPTLQWLCMNVFCLYIQDYIQALGRDEVRNAISMFPPSMITELSIMASSTTASFATNMSATTTTTNANTKKKQNHNSSVIRPTGINDDIAYVLGNHQHVQQLCFRCGGGGGGGGGNGTTNISTSTNSTHSILTDEGLLGLLPRRMSKTALQQNTKDEDNDNDSHHDDGYDKHDDGDSDTKSREDGNKNNDDDNDDTWDDDSVVDDWEDADSDDDKNNDFIDDHRYVHKSCDSYQYLPPDRLISTMAVDGCNLKLRRLELLDCHYISSDVVLKLLDRCCGITHLSLAGSFVHKPMHGIRILKSLPQTLPSLLVLDVSRCTTWATPSLLKEVFQQYRSVRRRANNSSKNNNRIPLPIAYYTHDQRPIINPHEQQRPSSIQPGETIKDIW